MSCLDPRASRYASSGRVRVPVKDSPGYEIRLGRLTFDECQVSPQACRTQPDQEAQSFRVSYRKV